MKTRHIFARCSTISAFYVTLIYIGFINFSLWETWVSKVRMLVVNFYLGEDIQLNCSALLNEKDVIYWHTPGNNKSDPNVHEGNMTRIRYGYVIYCCCSATKSCLTLCSLSHIWLYPMDCSPPCSSVHGILQARILEWDAISSSWGSSQPRDQTCIFGVSCIAGRFFTLWFQSRWAVLIF